MKCIRECKGKMRDLAEVLLLLTSREILLDQLRSGAVTFTAGLKPTPLALPPDPQSRSCLTGQELLSASSAQLLHAKIYTL
jgi:hypothetical protein